MNKETLWKPIEQFQKEENTNVYLRNNNGIIEYTYDEVEQPDTHILEKEKYFIDELALETPKGKFSIEMRGEFYDGLTFNEHFIRCGCFSYVFRFRDKRLAISNYNNKWFELVLVELKYSGEAKVLFDAKNINEIKTYSEITEVLTHVKITTDKLYLLFRFPEIEILSVDKNGKKSLTTDYTDIFGEKIQVFRNFPKIEKDKRFNYLLEYDGEVIKCYTIDTYTDLKDTVSFEVLDNKIYLGCKGDVKIHNLRLENNNHD